MFSVLSFSNIFKWDFESLSENQCEPVSNNLLCLKFQLLKLSLMIFFVPSMAFNQLTAPAPACDETPQEMNAKGMR